MPQSVGDACKATRFPQGKWRPVTFAVNLLFCAAPFALVAQLDRASDFESEGREFESLRARQEDHKVYPTSNILVKLH
jgi:hypothetical protein